MTKKTKAWLIVAITLILIGAILFVGVMTMFGWNFRRLSTVEYVTKSYEITEDFKNIFIDTVTADIEFLPSENEKTIVECYELIKTYHSVRVVDDSLEIKLQDRAKNWFIGINFDTPKITVYIPKGEYAALTVEATTGDIKIPDAFQFNNIDVSITTGDVKCSASANENVKIKTTTGDIDLKNVIASKIAISATTGDISLYQCDADELYLKATTGDITGSLLSDKVFVAKSTTGDIDVPQSTTGGKCEIKVTTGDINIEIK